MRSMIRIRVALAAACVSAPLAARGDGPPTPHPAPLPGIGLIDALRSGAVAVDAEGTGDGRMAITVVNQTSKKLRVVLPPGLVASGATGQFGGMGGMGGGGMGGMGGMGGGMMGGMGGGRGGMGGGMMGGRGGMGGGMSGGRMLTMPASMGMMMLGRLIMQLVEPTESWNPRSLMTGMMGGGMMGGMGGGMGGMGGMGGGMMGGMGGGFRSVPPTGLPDATLKPGQARRLTTRVVSLNGPTDLGGVRFPGAGEKLLIGDVTQVSSDPRLERALRRLAADKAPETVSQLVLWNVAGRLDWGIIAQITGGWANAQELALARQFVERLDAMPEGESGELFVEVTAGESVHEGLAGVLGKAFASKSVLGLKAASGVPSKPVGPSVGCKVQVVGEPGKPEALVQVAESNGHKEWKSMGKFSFPVPLGADGLADPAAFGDRLAEGILGRLVRVKLIKGRKGLEGQATYTVQVDNASPLILNGVSMVGSLAKPSEPPRYLLGVALPPQGSLQLPISPGNVEAQGLKKGMKLVGVNLSAL